MEVQGKKRKKGTKRSDRRAHGIVTYYQTRYPAHKLRRILDGQGRKNSGLNQAKSWAAKHLVTGVLLSILKRRKNVTA